MTCLNLCPNNFTCFTNHNNGFDFASEVRGFRFRWILWFRYVNGSAIKNTKKYCAFRLRHIRV